VINLSTAGSSARFKKSTTLSKAPERSKSFLKNLASSAVMPIAQNITANSSSSPSTFAWRAICAATRLWGSPLPEKRGSFCPLTRVFIPSMTLIPVWMNSLGYCLA